MGLPFYQVDAFTSEPFRGNPAAVVILDEERPDDWLQAVALENNLSETAFLLPAGDLWRLRWFTPGAEVDLCGHATLAAAHVLTTHRDAGDELRFRTRSGELRASSIAGGIQLDFPAEPAVALESDTLNVAEAFDVDPLTIASNRMYLLVEVEDAGTVRDLHPDFAKIGEWPHIGVCVTATTEDPRYDFISRFFAPVVGVDEDPVTGSAHCMLGPFWADRMGKSELTGFQASRRGGVVNVRVDSDRVFLSGQSVTVIEGILDVD